MIYTVETSIPEHILTAVLEELERAKDKFPQFSPRFVVKRGLFRAQKIF